MQPVFSLLKMPSRYRVPVWIMGLTNLVYGLCGSVVAFAVPQLLGDRHVPESAIAGLTAVPWRGRGKSLDEL